jgi:hypothetical protein
VLVISSLEEILAYQNDDVVARFSDDYSVPLSDSVEIFHEMKRWLWLAAKRAVEFKAGRVESIAIPLFNEARAIDLMWHTFLIYTRDYADFCERYFGFFLHHQPRAKLERDEWIKYMEANPEAARLERRANLKKVYELIHDEFGPETLVKWCEEFPARFTL